MTAWSQIVEQAAAQTPPEIVSVVAAILYLLFAIREQIVCWLFAALSTAIYVWVFFDARLYMESFLNVFYLLMAAYGWYSWSSGRQHGHKKAVVSWPWKVHGSAILILGLVSVLNGRLLSLYTDAAYPYADSLTTWFAIWATFLVARKVLENWWYWLLIDIASVFIFWFRDLQLTGLLFGVYVMMIPFGFMSWKRSMQQSALASA